MINSVKIEKGSPWRQNLSVFICAFVRTMQAENRAVVNAHKKREKMQRAEKCLDMRYFLL